MSSPAELMRRSITNALYDALMQRPGPTPIGSIVRALPEGLTISAQFAQEVMENDPRFTCDAGRCDLTIRASLTGANLKSAIERVAEDRGAPLPVQDLAGFLALTNKRDPGHYLQALSSAPAGAPLAHLVGDRLVPLGWVLIPEGDNEDDVLFYSDLDSDPLLAALRPSCTSDDLRALTPAGTAANILRAAGRPVPNRILDFLVYRLHPREFEPLRLLAAMLDDPAFYALPGLCWTIGVDRAQIATALVEADPYAAASRARARELARLLEEPLPPEHPGYYIADEHIDALYDLLGSSPQPIEVADILSDILALPPDHPDYLAAAHSVRTLLVDDPSIVALGRTTFVGQAGIPQWARQLPAGLLPGPSDAPEDVILRPEGLRPGLAERLADPYWEDFGDPTPPVPRLALSDAETTLTLLAHHCATGAIKLRALDHRLFGEAPQDPRPITLVGPGGTEVIAWLNADLGMICGLLPLITRHQWASGTLLTIARAETPGRFYLSSPGEDPDTTLSAPRAAELVALSQPSSACALLQSVLAAYPDGARFERLLADLNAIRRVSRLQLASLLSYYQVFRPRDQQGDDWVLVPDAQGIVAGKDKHIITPEAS